MISSDTDLHGEAENATLQEQVLLRRHEGACDRPMRTAVVLDPHPLWIDAVQSVLKRSGIEVVGVATNAAAALDLVETHAPDLFVTDVARADADDGFAVIREARQRAPSARVLALSASDDADLIQDALGAGALAYVAKTADPEDVAFAVRHTLEPSIFLAGQIRPRAPASDSGNNSAARELTKRELEILKLVAEGDSNIQLARRLWVTEQTVKFHLSNIYRKLGVANRTEASRWAQVHGLLDVDHAPEQPY